MTEASLTVAPAYLGIGRYNYGPHVAPSWSTNLIKAGFHVTPFELLPAEQGGVAINAEVDAIVIPYSVFNTSAGHSLAPQALLAIEAGRKQEVPLFSEISLADHLDLSDKALRGYGSYHELRAISKDIGETVIGQDISIIMNELGEQ